MTSALDTIRYHSGIAGEEVADMVDSLEQEVSTLREQVEKLTKERDALKTVPMKYRRMQFNAEIQDEVTQLQKQLLALAEQNAKMREALTKWRYLDSSYNWRCGHCGNEVEDGHKEGCALSLPNLATPVLNRIKAEAYREAADIVENIDVYTFVHGGSSYDDGGITLSSAATAIRAKADEYLISALDTIADELEKQNG